MCEFRREARRRGFAWSDLRAAFEVLWDGERQKRERPNEIRATAWMMATGSTPGCWPFWRHGFLSRWGGRIAKGQDYTIVPGYDEIGQQIATQFPEYATADGTERLFAFLLSPYDRLPARADVYRRALEMLEVHLSAVPF